MGYYYTINQTNRHICSVCGKEAMCYSASYVTITGGIDKSRTVYSANSDIVKTDAYSGRETGRIRNRAFARVPEYAGSKHSALCESCFQELRKKQIRKAVAGSLFLITYLVLSVVHPEKKPYIEGCQMNFFLFIWFITGTNSNIHKRRILRRFIIWRKKIPISTIIFLIINALLILGTL